MASSSTAKTSHEPDLSRFGSRGRLLAAEAVAVVLAVVCCACLSDFSLGEPRAAPCTDDADCDDDNPCTSEFCADGVCSYSFVDGSCDDYDPCTENDRCNTGSCHGALIDADGDGHVPSACGGDDCDDAAATTYPGAPEGPLGLPTCADGLDNDCDGAIDQSDTSCAPCDTDADCDDDNLCNGAETCMNGTCRTREAIDCSDGDLCTVDACEPTTGACSNLAITCTGDDICNPETGTCELEPCLATAFADDLEAGDGGLTHYSTGGNDPWQFGTSTAGSGCHSGNKCWATTLGEADYPACMSAVLESPSIDLSACRNAPRTVRLAFWHWYEFIHNIDNNWWDGGMVQLSSDGGASWRDVSPAPGYVGAIMGAEGACGGHGSGTIQNHQGWGGWGGGWLRVTIYVPHSHRTANFRYRFVVGSDGYNAGHIRRGWILDDIALEVD